MRNDSNVVFTYPLDRSYILQREEVTTMLITICNSNLQLTVDTLGAQMMALFSADGTQYLWQGDSKYWEDRAPNLFPFIGRLTNNSYKIHGQIYPMGIHGFAAASEFRVVDQTEDYVRLVLKSNAKTKKQYPFEFSFSVSYRIQESTVAVTYKVENPGGEVMPFGVGGHPGFNVPFVKGECFEDYILEFDTACEPDRVGFTPQVYLSGNDTKFPLRDGKYLRLSHDLFCDDAVILKNMARKVTLRSNVSGHAITVSYPDMPYVGLWHWPNTDAPYLCIEPWSSLPARQDVVEEFSCKSDLIHLAPNKVYENTWMITVLR